MMEAVGVVLLIVGVVCWALLMMRDRFELPKSPLHTPGVFWYKYQRHPFDDAQYFKIEAESQAEADKKAIAHFEALFKAGHTVMTVCYPTTPPVKG